MTRSGRLWSPLRGKEELKHFSSLNRGAFPIWSSCYRDAIWYENQPPVMNERSCDNEENARDGESFRNADIFRDLPSGTLGGGQRSCHTACEQRVNIHRNFC